MLCCIFAYRKRMKKQNYFFRNPAFFDMLLQQKVRQVGLSETHEASLSLTSCFSDCALLCS